MHSWWKNGLSALMGLALGTSAWALDVKITPELDYVEVLHEGRVVRVQRIQDQDHRIKGGYTKTSRRCPPFCIQPIEVAPGVRTLGELEVLDFLQQEVMDGTGVLIDARTPPWHRKGTIPGSVNIPFTVFEMSADEPELIEAMERLGVVEREDVPPWQRYAEGLGLLNGELKNDVWDFTNAKHIVLWCNGPWCGQSPRAIRALLEHGYPAERIGWYRGGMQLWQLFGLTTIVPEE